MENNIFIRNKKKFNPDIHQKFNNKESELNNTKFDIKKTIYNPITNFIPQTITCQRDLEIKVNNNINIKDRLRELEKERNNQDIFKPIQNKSIHEKIDGSVNSFTDLKTNAVQKQNNNNQYDNMLNDLKKLGIIT